MSLKRILYSIPFFLTSVLSIDLAPIHSLEDITGLHTASKRAANYTEDLNLQNVESFFWGAPAGDNLVYANLTVYFPERYEQIIAMERFAGKLKSVNCAEDMVLEFVDKAAFDYARSVWNWVNQETNNTFIMVTNYEGCADDMERLPFEVHNIAYDHDANTAYLAADLKNWQEVSHSYTLHIGHVPLTPVHRMMMERGVMPRSTDFAMNLASSFNRNLFTRNIGGWTTSVDASFQTTGTLNVDFDLDVDWFNIKSAGMKINPESISASLQLALSQTGILSNPYNWRSTVISVPVEGISIAGIIKLGAFLDVDIGFTMEEWTGAAHADIGARVEISDDAIVQVDLVNSQNNKFSGWTPKFSVIPPTLSARVDGSAQAFAEPNIKLEASALGLGFNVGLGMRLPYIQADFAALYDSTGGVCASENTFGVDFKSKIGVDIGAQAAFTGNEANPFWRQQIYAHEWPLYNTCLAFGASGASQGEVAALNAKMRVATTQSTPTIANDLEEDLSNSTAPTNVGGTNKNTTASISATVPTSSTGISIPTSFAIYSVSLTKNATATATIASSSSTPAVPTKSSASLLYAPTPSTATKTWTSIYYETKPEPTPAKSSPITYNLRPSSGAQNSSSTVYSSVPVLNSIAKEYETNPRPSTNISSSAAYTTRTAPTSTPVVSIQTPCSTLITRASTSTPVPAYSAMIY